MACIVRLFVISLLSLFYGYGIYLAFHASVPSVYRQFYIEKTIKKYPNSCPYHKAFKYRNKIPQNETERTYYIVSIKTEQITNDMLALIASSAHASHGVIILLDSNDKLYQPKEQNFYSIETRKTLLKNIKGVIDVLVLDGNKTILDGITTIQNEYPQAKLVFATDKDENTANLFEIVTCQHQNISIAYEVGIEYRTNFSTQLLNKHQKKKEEILNSLLSARKKIK